MAESDESGPLRLEGHRRVVGHAAGKLQIQPLEIGFGVRGDRISPVDCVIDRSQCSRRRAREGVEYGEEKSKLKERGEGSRHLRATCCNGLIGVNGRSSGACIGRAGPGCLTLF